MSIKLISLKCPACGQVLSIEEGREKAFCSYCGTPILVNNENEYTFKHVDEAEVARAETERLVKLQELENQKQEDTYNLKTKKVLTFIWIVLTVVLLVIIVSLLTDYNNEKAMVIGFGLLEFIAAPIIGGGAYLIFKVLPEKRNEKIILKNGGIRFPNSVFPCDEKKYSFVLEILKNAGFTNISCLNMQDINGFAARFQSNKIDRINKIEVNGKEITAGGKVYLPDVPIVITYHGK